MLPGKKSKAKCYSINSTLSTQKNNPLQAQIRNIAPTPPAWAPKEKTSLEFPSSLSGYLGRGCAAAPCQRDGAGPPAAWERENVTRPEHKGQDGISLLMWWSHIQGKIYLAVSGQSLQEAAKLVWYQYLLVHLTQSTIQDPHSHIPKMSGVRLDPHERMNPQKCCGKWVMLFAQLGTCQTK